MRTKSIAIYGISIPKINQCGIINHNNIVPVDDVVESLKKMDHVVYCSKVSGSFDIVAKLQGKSTDELRDVIYWKLRKENGMSSTLSLKVVV